MLNFDDADFDSITGFLSTAAFDEMERRFYAEPPQDYSHLVPERKLTKADRNGKKLSEMLGIEFNEV